AKVNGAHRLLTNGVLETIREVLGGSAYAPYVVTNLPFLTPHPFATDQVFATYLNTEPDVLETANALAEEMPALLEEAGITVEVLGVSQQVYLTSVTFRVRGVN